MIGINDLNIVVELYISSSHYTFTLSTETQNRFLTAVHPNCQPLQVEQYIDNVLLDTLNCSIFMEYAVNFDCCYGRSRQGGK